MVYEEKNRLDMKRLIILSFFVITASLIGQEIDYKYGPDKTATENNLSIYTEFYKQKNYVDAYNSWKYLLNNAPARTKNIYIHGSKIMKSLIDNEMDSVRKEIFIDTLLYMYDTRNIFFPGKEGYVLGLKGKDMYKYRSSNIDNLLACQKTLLQAFKLDGLNSSATTLNYYFTTTAKLVKADAIETEELIALFSDVSEVIDYRQASLTESIFTAKNDSLLDAKGEKELSKNKKELGRLEDVKTNIEKTLAPHSTCESLVKLYSEKYNENKDNEEWLKRSAKLLIKKDCTDEQIYLNIVSILHEKSPTAESAFNMGVRMIRNNNNDEALGYFLEALENEEDYINKSKYAFYVAKTYFAKYNKQDNINFCVLAKKYAIQATNYRAGWGEPYILIGDLYSKTSTSCGNDPLSKKAGYWAAVEKYEYAESIDSKSAKSARKKIEVYKLQIPTQSLLFENNYIDQETYTIDCWYTETVKIRNVID
tara:strand:- start:218 stop:1657 length:1440 start_codon:yes stop_codon:yes gene_type:complete